MPGEVEVRSVEEQFLLQLGAVCFCARASSIQTGDGVDEGNDGEGWAGRSGALDLTGVILHFYLLHFPSSYAFNTAPDLSTPKAVCTHRFAK